MAHNSSTPSAVAAPTWTVSGLRLPDRREHPLPSKLFFTPIIPILQIGLSVKYEAFWSTIAQIMPLFLLTLLASIRFTRLDDSWKQRSNGYKASINFLQGVILLISATIEMQSLVFLSGGDSSNMEFWKTAALVNIYIILFGIFLPPIGMLLTAAISLATWQPRSRWHILRLNRIYRKSGKYRKQVQDQLAISRKMLKTITDHQEADLSQLSALEAELEVSESNSGTLPASMVDLRERIDYLRPHIKAGAEIMKEIGELISQIEAMLSTIDQAQISITKVKGNIPTEIKKQAEEIARVAERIRELPSD